MAARARRPRTRRYPGASCHGCPGPRIPLAWSVYRWLRGEPANVAEIGRLEHLDGMPSVALVQWLQWGELTRALAAIGVVGRHQGVALLRRLPRLYQARVRDVDGLSGVFGARGWLLNEPRRYAPPPMRATGTFKVITFDTAPVAPAPEITTNLSVGVATMEKAYEGEVTGRSATLFTSAFDHGTGVGTYLALESFEGALHGASGTFNFAHAATTTGQDRSSEHFVIVPTSGTGELTGIRGTGGIAIDTDGTHRIWFDYELG